MVDWIGKRVEQVKASEIAFQFHVGRVATVVESFTDEKDQIHIKTDDGIWCPAGLVIPI